MTIPIPGGETTHLCVVQPIADVSIIIIAWNLEEVLVIVISSGKVGTIERRIASSNSFMIAIALHQSVTRTC
jgi:hypothetical protein